MTGRSKVPKLRTNIQAGETPVVWGTEAPEVTQQLPAPVCVSKDELKKPSIIITVARFTLYY